MPQRGRMGRKAGTRELPVAGLPFVIIYRVRGETVEVVRIIHGAQQWP
jgi:toxin ParE1/3/4